MTAASANHVTGRHDVVRHRRQTPDYRARPADVRPAPHRPLFGSQQEAKMNSRNGGVGIIGVIVIVLVILFLVGVIKV
jgi:hypothetical protein